MSALSDQLLVASILAYLVAVLTVATAQVIAVPSRASARPGRALAAPSRELVGAAVGAIGTGTDARPEPGAATTTGGAEGGGADVDAEGAAGGGTARRAALLDRIGVFAFAVAALVHLGTTTTRGLAAERMPWGNMYEFVLTVTVIGSGLWLASALRWPGLRALTMYVALAQTLLLGIAGMVLYTEIAPLVPALKSSWFVIHVSGAALASAIFLLGFVAASLHLVRSGYERGKRGFPYSFGHRVPAASVLEPLAFRLHAVAFPIWTFAVAAGAVWAEAAWGRYWGWDPKETWAFVSWVVYAGYLHARATPSVRRNVVMWIAIVGWLTMLMNLFGVNIFFAGLHSYGGV